MMDEPTLQSQLEVFTGTERYYPHWSGAFVYTDGVAFLAENAGAHWLLDLIASWQPRTKFDPMLREFQLWELVVVGSMAVATCLRDTDDEAFSQDIDYTNFPLERIELYLEGGVLMLPSER